MNRDKIVEKSDEITTQSPLPMKQKLMSSYLEVRKEAAKEFRLLTNPNTPIKFLNADIEDALPMLLTVLSQSSEDFEMQEDLVTTFHNLTNLNEDTKKLVVGMPIIIPHILEVVRRGSMQGRSSAAAVICSLSVLDPLKVLIGELGAMDPLVLLLKEGDIFAKTNAATAIFNLCSLNRNKGKAVVAGAVGVIANVVIEGVLVIAMIKILLLLATEKHALDEMAKHGAVKFLLEAIRQEKNEKTRENAIAIISVICRNDLSKLDEVRADEDVHGSLLQLSETGTAGAQMKATNILSIFEKLRDLASFVRELEFPGFDEEMLAKYELP